MSAIRPDLPSRPFGAASPAGAPSGPQTGRASAFFRAALGEAAPATTQPEAPRDMPVRAMSTSGAEQRLQRPGSLLNILV